ncbi:siderophore-interacting protein [Rhodopseudomonas sp. BR0M22]|nr:siderophore-interacting protein [Rhodopseudomonas sp. BR0M22]
MPEAGRAGPAARQIDVDLVMHAHGVASRCAAGAKPGDPAGGVRPG